MAGPALNPDRVRLGGDRHLLRLRRQHPPRHLPVRARAPRRGVTAAEVAERFGLHVNVARHHLDKLAAGGYVEVVVERPRGGGAGRPSKRYRPTQAALTPALPIRHDVVLINLLKRALSLLPRDAGRGHGRGGRRRVRPGHGRGHGRRGREPALVPGGAAHGRRRHDRPRLRRPGGRVGRRSTRPSGAGERGELRIVAEHCPFGGPRSSTRCSARSTGAWCGA